MCMCVCVHARACVRARVCACVCERARACVCVCVCVCTYIVIVKYFVFKRFFLAPCSIELFMFYCKMYRVFYVNGEPEGRFLYTETIKLYCIVVL